MKVSELIERLSAMPRDVDVILEGEDGFVYLDLANVNGPCGTEPVENTVCLVPGARL